MIYRCVATAIAIVLVTALPARAQNYAIEAEIKQAVPYSAMLRENPRLTLDEYNAAVREVARRQAGPSSSTSSRVGGTTYYNDNTGVTGTATRVGKTTYYNYSDGTTGTKNKVGQTDYHSLTSPRGRTTSGTSSQVGQFQYHNFSNGVSGTSTQIGNTRYDTFSNGKSCTTTKVGSYNYTNCN